MTETPDDDGEVVDAFADAVPLRAPKRKRPSVVPAAEDAEEVGEIDLWCARKDLNDSGNAERLVRRFGENIMFTPGFGPGVWDGKRWNFDAGENLALGLAKQTQRAMLREFFAASKDKTFPGSTGELYKHGINSGNIGKLRAMLQCAEPDRSVPLDSLDANPFLFNAENTALDFKRDFDSLAIAFDRAHHVTKIASTAFVPNAKAPQWEKFLEEIHPQIAVREFLQRAAGLSVLTGDMSEERLFICWGRGGDGKSTFLRTLSHIAGDYAATAPIDLFLEGPPRSGNEPTPQLIRLVGARFVLTTEPNSRVTLGEGIIKTATGRDPIPVRQLNQKAFELKPQFKLWMALNDKPIVKGSSDAFWRRVILIPFMVQTPADRIDKRLGEKLLAEAPGILNWLIEGLFGWFEHGLAVPAEILEAVQSYRADMDPVGRFLTECTVPSIGHVSAKDMYERYQAWCTRNDEDPMKKRGFGMALSNKGIRRKHANGSVYVDVGIVPENDLASGIDFGALNK